MPQSEAIWVVDDDQSIRWVLERALTRAQMSVRTFESATELLRALKRDRPEAIISDIRMPDMDGFELLDAVQRDYQDLPVIIMTAHSDMDSAVSAFESGAFEYLPKPFDINEATELARRACEHGRVKEVKAAAVDESDEITESALSVNQLRCRACFGQLVA